MSRIDNVLSHPNSVLKTVKIKRKPNRRPIVAGVNGMARGSLEGLMTRNSSKASLDMPVREIDPETASLSSVTGSIISTTSRDGDVTVEAPNGHSDLFTRDDIVSPDMHLKARAQGRRRVGIRGVLKSIVNGSKNSSSEHAFDAGALERIPSAASLSQEGNGFALLPPSDGEASVLDGAAEEQKYDTSAKQRVPSWCDRVLWRSAAAEAEPAQAAQEGLGKRVGAALSNAINSAKAKQAHFLSPVSATFAAPATAREARFAGASSNTPRQPSITFAEGPTTAPLPREDSAALPRSITFDPDAKHGIMSPAPRAPPRRRSSLTSARAKQDDFMAGHFTNRRASSPIKQERSTEQGGDQVDQPVRRRRWSRGAASKGDVPRRSLSVGSIVRSNSDSAAESASQDAHLRLGNGPLSAGTGGHARRATWWQEHVSPYLPTFLHDGDDGAAASADGSGAASAPARRMSFGMPAWLSSAGAGASEMSGAPAVQLVGPEKGVVECMTYRALNDWQMRQLEGRSDHRPVIFVASIGI